MFTKHLIHHLQLWVTIKSLQHSDNIIVSVSTDLLLCLVTMPLTLVEILTKYWPMGRLPFLCKSIGTLQATSIFVSTISITAIALDRYQVSKPAIVNMRHCICQLVAGLDGTFLFPFIFIYRL